MQSKFNKLKIPNKSGVYFFRKGGKILYIGKATSLKDRVKSYFGKDLIQTRGPLLVDMVFKADKISWEITDSVLEALILEAELIKKHQPYYNTREKDDKSFLCVIITSEKLPRILTVRAHTLKQSSNPLKGIKISKIYGPFTSGPQLREAMKIIRRIFPYLDEKSKNYLEFYKQINLAPDINDRKLYLQNIQNIKLLFSGKKKQILKNLKKEMKEFAKKREFERAGEVKRQIFALQHINDIALIKGEVGLRREGQNERDSAFRIEAYDIAHMSGKNMVGVMVVVEDGQVNKSEYRKFKIRTQSGANDTGALVEVLQRRMAHTEWPFPSLIAVDGGVAQINATEKLLKELGVNIPVVSVVKDERHKPKDILSSSGKAFGEVLSTVWGLFPRTSAKLAADAVLLANSEAHRFAITYHKKMRGKNFLK